MPKLKIAAAAVAAASVTVTAKTVTTVNPRLESLLADRLATGAKLAQLEAKKQSLDADILKHVLRLAGERGRVNTGEYSVVDVHSSSSYIDKQKLVELGVSPTVIAKATKSKPYSYPKVSRIGRPEGEAAAE